MQSKATSDGKDLCRTYRERTFRNSERHSGGAAHLGSSRSTSRKAGIPVAFQTDFRHRVGTTSVFAGCLVDNFVAGRQNHLAIFQA